MTATVDQVVGSAASQVGYYEAPGGARSKFEAWFPMSGQWCAMGLSWVFNQVGALDIFPKHAYTPSGVNWFKGMSQWHDGLSGIRRGDVVFFDFPGAPARVSHIGIVESVNSDGSVNTIEFNTSATFNGDQRNGGCVARKRRKAYIVGFGRPAYANVPTPAPATVDSRPRNADGSLTIKQDGDRGRETIGRWQEVMNTPVDWVISRPESGLIKADQRFLNANISEGDMRNLTGKPKLSVDGDEGERTVRARQYLLRNWMNPVHQHNLIGHLLDFDGDLGRETNLVHQFALNNATSGSGQYGHV